MNQESFEMSPAARRRLDGYLDQIERLLMASGVDRLERRSILDDVEAQALEMLQERTPYAEENDMEEVLARLDAPEEYARAASERSAEPEAAGAALKEPRRPSSPVAAAQADSPRLSRKAIIGALMLVPVFFLVPATLFLVASHRDLQTGLTFSYLGGLLTFFAPGLFWILMCLLGIAAIIEIRRSDGRIYGMGLAVFDALLPPLILLDWIVLAFIRSRTYYYSWPNWYGGPASLSGLGTAVFILALDALIVWWVWKRVNQPPSTAAPGGQILQSNINIP